MVEVIPNRLQKTWEIWNVRGVILFSLSLQIVLFLGAPMRKRTGNRFYILIIWASYFLADWAASFTIGLITSSRNSSKIVDRSDLLAFWAPFLLLHLGGPDTITAFSLEDNELWLRHFLTLIFQVLASFYVFLETLPNNKLWLPTSLIFLAGVIKYSERTRSLYRASWRTFRESILTNATHPLRRLDLERFHHELIDEFEVVKYGYHFFKILKGLIVDLISVDDRIESREFFRGRNPEDALEVLEVELNFMYEVLYTKFVVMHDLKGYLLRFLSSVSVLVSLGIFFFLDCKNGLDKFDMRVTYTLLLGALSLEAIALFKLIFSDWTAAFIDKRTSNRRVRAIFQIYLKIRRSRWSLPKDKLAGTESRSTSLLLRRWSKCNNESATESIRTTPVLLRRWSESVTGFNLITYCLKELPKKSNEENYQCCLGISKTTTHLLHPIRKYCRKEVVIDGLGAKDFLDEWNYASKNSFTKELWAFIFHELKLKSEKEDTQENLKTISSARGAYVLEEYEKRGREEGRFERLKNDYIENVSYDKSLLLWHIATELCYGRQDSDPKTVAQTVAKHRRLSKLLSDYMLYLLVMKPTMMSAVAGIGQIRYTDTCAQAKRFFHNKGLGPHMEKEACENLINAVNSLHQMEDKRTSVLIDACELAKELQELEGIKKWEVISKVWVEMLSYASNHCRPDAHIQQVSRGGQLINLVWLLMAHFGLVDQFIFYENDLIAEKK